MPGGRAPSQALTRLRYPLGFLASILAALAFPSRKAEEMWDEIYVRQNTGLGMAKAVDH